MLKAADFIAWAFPFIGAILVLRGDHVLFIAAGCVAGCTFERIAEDIRARLGDDRQVSEIDRQLLTRMRELGEADGV